MDDALIRTAEVVRQTSETNVRLELVLDGHGEAHIDTGVGFLDHMLTSFAKHGSFDLRVLAEGDLNVDEHHTVEDVGLALGDAFAKALGNMSGIVRFGHAVVPMDESLVEAVVDLSGRPYFACDLPLEGRRCGQLNGELVGEFCRGLAFRGGITMHLRHLAGGEPHHIAEAAFKALGRALDEASRRDPRVQGVPSTKGTLGQ